VEADVGGRSLAAFRSSTGQPVAAMMPQAMATPLRLERADSHCKAPPAGG